MAGYADKSHRCSAYTEGAAGGFLLTLPWLFFMPPKSQEDVETFRVNPGPVTAGTCHSSPDPSRHYCAFQSLRPFSPDSFLPDTLSVELLHHSLQALLGNRSLLYTSKSHCLLPLDFQELHTDALMFKSCRISRGTACLFSYTANSPSEDQASYSL